MFPAHRIGMIETAAAPTLPPLRPHIMLSTPCDALCAHVTDDAVYNIHAFDCKMIAFLFDLPYTTSEQCAAKDTSVIDHSLH